MLLRPTPDALRERAFAVLADLLTGASFLDLYAGTGAVGFEALSRGAREVLFVEHHRAAARLITANRDTLGVASDTARLVVAPVRRAVHGLARQGRQFTIAWADPPFLQWQEGAKALAAAFASSLLAPDATACLECPAAAEAGELGADLEIRRDLAGGASRLLMLSWRTADQA